MNLLLESLYLGYDNKAMTMKTHRFLLIILAVLASTLLIAGPALAYLDPASSTFILQTIVAGIFSGLYFIKLNWLRLKSFFTGGKGKIAELENPPEGDQAEK